MLMSAEHKQTNKDVDAVETERDVSGFGGCYLIGREASITITERPRVMFHGWWGVMARCVAARLYNSVSLRKGFILPAAKSLHSTNQSRRVGNLSLHHNPCLRGPTAGYSSRSYTCPRLYVFMNVTSGLFCPAFLFDFVCHLLLASPSTFSPGREEGKRVKLVDKASTTYSKCGKHKRSLWPTTILIFSSDLDIIVSFN